MKQSALFIVCLFLSSLSMIAFGAGQTAAVGLNEKSREIANSIKILINEEVAFAVFSRRNCNSLAKNASDARPLSICRQKYINKIAAIKNEKMTLAKQIAALANSIRPSNVTQVTNAASKKYPIQKAPVAGRNTPNTVQQ